MKNKEIIRKPPVITNNFNSSNFELGNVYFLLTQIPTIKLSVFINGDKVRFINAPFPEAIKILTYLKKRERISSIIDEINALGITDKKIDRYSLYEQIIIILFIEIKEMDKIIIETSGLDDSSVVRLMRFCLKLVDLFKNKVVFIVENRVIKEDKPSNLIIHQITDEFIEQAEHDRNW